MRPFFKRRRSPSSTCIDNLALPNQDDMIEALTGAMHWCDETGQSFALLLAFAYEAYQAQVEDLRAHDRRPS